jgi:hypothetical protein
MPSKPFSRAGVTPLDTPPAVLAVARCLPGWAYASSFTTQDAKGRVTCELRLAFRGGFAVPHAPFRAINGVDAIDGAWRVTHVHSHVSGGAATVWLHLERVP